MDESFNSKLTRLRVRKNKKRILNVASLLLVIFVLILGVTIFGAKRITATYQGAYSTASYELVDGYGVIVGDYVIALSKNMQFIGRAKGYLEQVILFSEYQSREVIINFKYSLQNLKISAATGLTNPRWYLDDTLVSQDQVANIYLEPGTYAVKVLADNIYETNRVVDLTLGEDSDIRLVLVNRNPLVTVASEPSGADVYISSEYVGSTPLSVSLDLQLTGSSVDLLVEKEGFEPISDKIEIVPRQDEVHRTYRMQGATTPLELVVVPENGILKVDSIVVVGFNSGDQVRVSKSQGSEIEYEKFGYRSQKVTVSANEKTLAIELAPIYSRLLVQTSPESDVQIDGVFVGRTPIDMELQIGDYQITMTEEEYVEISQPLRITENQITTMSEDLETEFDYLYRTSPISYVNTASSTLLKVSGGRLLLGAPRNERGQRANEIIRDVNFRRSFYVSAGEITASQYNDFRTTNNTGDTPVRDISWIDAAEYCNWLSAKEGYSGFYQLNGGRLAGYDADSRGYRLPTEAEWEYLAKRHGKRSASIFTWGENYTLGSDSGNIADNSADGLAYKSISTYDDGYKEVAPIKTYAPLNGFYDLSGNVSEYVHDYYTINPLLGRSISVDYLGPTEGSQKVVKGSNYLSADWTELRAAFREPIDMGVGRHDVGFRIARYVN